MAEVGLRGVVRRRPVLSFVVVTLGFSWGIWVPMAVAGSGSHVPGLVGPLVGAVTVSAAIGGTEGLRSLGFRMTHWRGGFAELPIILAPWLMLAVAIPIAAVVDGEWIDLGELGRIEGWPDVGLAAMFGLQVLIVGFGEESGWRGFLLDELLRRHSQFAATGIVWAVWALWHVPIFWFAANFAEMDAPTVVGWLIGLAAGAAVLAWVYERTGRSILAVALWHGSFNVATASEVSEGVIAAVVTTAVMFWAVPLWRRWGMDAWKTRRGVAERPNAAS